MNVFDRHYLCGLLGGLAVVWAVKSGIVMAANASESTPFPHAVTVADLLQHQQPGGSLFLGDIRPAEACARVNIPNSLNIPLFAVNTTGFLTTRPVVLIDEGFRPKALNEACAHLNALGFEAGTVSY